MSRTTKIGFTTVLAAVILSGTAAYAQISSETSQAASPLDGNIVSRSLDNDPRERGAIMANEMAGEDIFLTDENGDLSDIPVDLEAAMIGADAVSREFGEDEDPITQRAILLLDESGIIGRQMGMSESIIIMDQQIRFNRKIEELMLAVGPEGLVEVSPGVFEDYSGTPAHTRAMIANIKLQQELATLLGQTSGVNEDAAVTDDFAGSDTVGIAMADTTPARDDGTQDQLVGASDPLSLDPEPPVDVRNQISNLLTEAEQRLIAREAGISFDVEDPAVDAFAQDLDEAVDMLPEDRFSLREVYGSAGVYEAVLEFDETRETVRVGDKIEGFQVVGITNSSLTMSKDGISTEIEF